MLFKSNNFQYLLCAVLILLCFSCSDDIDSIENLPGSSADTDWISNLGLETNWGELSMTNSNGYQVVGLDYILKIDADGNVTEEIQNPFSEPESGLFAITRVFDDKIYRFASIGYSSEDTDQKMEMEIYDMNGNLIESTTLEATYTLIDVVIEQDRITLLTWDWNDPDTTGASTNVFQVDYSGQLLFEKRLTSIPAITGRVFELILLDDGNFLIEYDKTLYKVNDEFEPISTFTFDDRVHTFMEGPNGNIYAGGFTQENTNFIVMLDSDLNKVNETSFNNELLNPTHPSLLYYAFGSLAVHDGNLYSLEVAFEYAQELRIQCFDLNLNEKNEFILEGSGPLSDLMINELGSVSFLYGRPYAPFEETPDTSNPTEARLFKLGGDCQIPEVTIDN